MDLSKELENYNTQMRKGMLEYCVLLALQHGKAYSPDIIAVLREANMIVVEGTLYTLLNRLRREEKLDYSWQESPKGAPRKYYQLTQKGRDTLNLLTQAWDSLANTVSMLRSSHLPVVAKSTETPTQEPKESEGYIQLPIKNSSY